MKDSIVRKGSTMYLRIALIASGLLTVLASYFVVKAILREWNIEFPYVTYLRLPVVAILCMVGLLVIFALVQAMKLLSLIDKDKAFSAASVRVLATIKLATLAVGLLLSLLMPFVYYVADKDDAPGLILVGAAMPGAVFAVTVSVAILHKLLKSAVAVKKENYLTV